MADAYATHNVTSAAVDTGDAVYFSGGAVTAIPFNFDTVDTDGDVIRVGTVSPQDIYLGVQLVNEASSGANDYDLGLYAPKVGDDGRPSRHALRSRMGSGFPSVFRNTTRKL